ncbi:MAG: TolC family protein [Opitutaceae bacterium]|nr:TolC family protein [Opitutaceae bacterium]
MKRAAFLALLAATALSAADAPYPIDLATALRLAGAQNLDVAVAQERLAEAEAAHEQARQKFFPWISPGVAWRRHDGRLQDVVGNMLDTRKQSLGLGVTIAAQVDVGEAYYQSLAAKQLTRAASESLNARRLEAVAQAAAGYFELARAQAAVGAASEAQRVADSYAAEVRNGVIAGVASAGDAARAEAQSARNRTLAATAAEQRAIAAARLATMLRLPPATDLQPREGELAPLTLFPAEVTPGALIAQALARRPEINQAGAISEAAATQAKAARVGPLLPSVGASAQVGGLRGGRGGNTWGEFHDSEDYAIGVSWRVGPGGLFDSARTRAADARSRTTKLEQERLRDQVTREVIEAHARVRGVTARLEAASQALKASETAWKFSRERRDFGVSVVFETVLAEQDYTKARLDYLQAIAEHNAAHYALQRAVGGTPGP